MKRNPETTKPTPRLAPLPSSSPEEVIPNGESPAFNAAAGEKPSLKIIPGLDPDDPFDPENARLVGGEILGAEKVVLSIPVRKPQSAEFFRAHSTLSIDTALLDHEQEKFFLTPDMRAVVAEALPFTLLYCINRNGGLFLWPIRLPGPDGRSNLWWDGARAAAGYAKDRWVRCWSNMSANSYDAVIATAHIPEPIWPAGLSMRDILHLAFKDRCIDHREHPVLKALRGEV